MAQYSLIVFLYRHFTYRANIELSNTEQDTSGEITQEGVSICAGCHRILEEGAVYELGKPWCTECYKTQ
jgi:protein-arginine kinase activator protein McsA